VADKPNEQGGSNCRKKEETRAGDGRRRVGLVRRNEMGRGVDKEED
jgi:hypothetical protein